MLRALKLSRNVWKPAKQSVRGVCVNAHRISDYVNFLKNMPEPVCVQLCNGLRVVTLPVDGAQHACIGLFVDAGSRYETHFENGFAHFFEHIAFKETRSRVASTLQTQMACTGARFKCFTERELACYYAECQCQDIQLVIDILADCVFNNNLSWHIIEEQKDIVYNEMMEQDSDPNFLLYDYLHAAAFLGTPLAQSVSGLSSNLHNVCDMTLGRYLYRVFSPTRTVLVAVGAVSPKAILETANLYLSQLEPSKCMEKTYRFSAGDFRFRNDALPLCNIAVAFEGPPFGEEDSTVMDVAAMFLGGWDRSQLCGNANAYHLAKAGYFEDLCDAYESFHIKYSDTSLWGIQFQAKRPIIDEFMHNLQKQFVKLCLSVTQNEVERAKNELQTRMMKRLETMKGMCMDLGRYYLYRGERPSLFHQLSAIDQVTAATVRETCTRYVYDRCPAIAAVGPCESLPDYTRIRANQYWLRN